MVQYVFTPWRDRAELLLVRDQLYKTPAEPLEQHKAVARASMWMQRGNCPHMVESTALLTAAVLSDADAVASAGASTYAVRAAYSAAFSRFVTGLLDGHQDKLRKQSMYSIAKVIGLPATFVELRHQATHEQLPSLAKLRPAAQKALAWIWDYYWKHLDAADGLSTSKADPCCEAVLAYLREEDETKKQVVVARMAAFRADALLKAVTQLQESLPGNQVFLKCLKLSKDIMAGTIKTSPDEDETMKDEAENEKNSDEPLQRQKASPDDSDIGWSRHVGPWKPKPIGMV